jgi:hypothetical protein
MLLDPAGVPFPFSFGLDFPFPFSFTFTTLLVTDPTGARQRAQMLLLDQKNN